MIDVFLEVNMLGNDFVSWLTRTSGGAFAGPERIQASIAEQLAARAPTLLAGNDKRELEDFGKDLYAAFLPGELGQLWRDSYALALGAKMPIRLRVNGIPGIPWELLHDGVHCLSTDPFSSVVRFFEEVEPDRPFSVVPPVQVLITSASQPAEGWHTAVAEAYGTWGELAAVPTLRYRLKLAELDEVFRRARNDGKPFHIWHHTGHGHSDPEQSEFRLQLHSTFDQTEFATIDQMENLLGANRDLRIVSLSVCHGGSPLGLAPALAKLNIPAVVAFPAPIMKRGADIFMKVFHEGLRTLPIEQAASDARRSLQCLRPDLSRSSLPLLFTRRTDWGPLLERKVGGAALKVPPARRNGRVTFKFGTFGGSGHTLVGQVGTVGKTQDVSFDTEQVSGEGHLFVGAIEGFSELEILKRNSRIQEIAGESNG